MGIYENKPPQKIENKRWRKILWLGAGLLSLSASGFIEISDPNALQPGVDSAVAGWLKVQTHMLQPDQENLALLYPQLVTVFYQQHGFSPVWVHASGLSFQALSFIHVLNLAETEGLQPEDYHLKKIKLLANSLLHLNRRTRSPMLAQAAQLDLLLTDAFFSYGSHLALGRISPAARTGGFYNQNMNWRLKNQLADALAQGQVFEFIQSQDRQDAISQGLRDSLQRYQQLAKRRAWPAIPEGPTLWPGASDFARISPVRKKLEALGDMEPGRTRDPAVLDPVLAAGLKRFQVQHGLIPSGSLNAMTVRLLNQPVEDVIQKLRFNMERWRWLPPVLGPKYILVNIPDFQLRIRENEETILSMKVVVGKQYQSTPVLASRVTGVVLNPSWTIPTKIIFEEKLPSILGNPDFFGQNHITIIEGWGENRHEVLPADIDWRHLKHRDYYELYRFRQEPGPWNSLGRIKFLLPNPYDIYLHDTPDQPLFAAAVRDFSHGCIRVEKPLALAEYLLGEPEVWNREQLSRAIQSRKEQGLDLPAPVPIYIDYMTILPDDDGLLHFYPDVYKQDKAMAAAWNQPGAVLSEASAQP